MNSEAILNSKHICFFCLKQTNSSSSNFTAESYKSIYTLFSKFVTRTLENEIDTISQEISTISQVRVCEPCVVIVQTINKIFHRIKCLETQLYWKLETLVETMKLANKEPSKVQHFDSIMKASKSQNPNVDNLSSTVSVASSRDKLVKKCEQILLKSPPRVLLQRLDSHNANHSFDKIGNSSSNLTTLHGKDITGEDDDYSDVADASDQTSIAAECMEPYVKDEPSPDVEIFKSSPEVLQQQLDTLNDNLNSSVNNPDVTVTSSLVLETAISKSNSDFTAVQVEHISMENDNCSDIPENSDQIVVTDVSPQPDVKDESNSDQSFDMSEDDISEKETKDEAPIPWIADEVEDIKDWDLSPKSLAQDPLSQESLPEPQNASSESEYQSEEESSTEESVTDSFSSHAALSSEEESISKKLIKNKKSNSKGHNRYKCKQDGCDLTFGNDKQYYLNHLQLHKEGTFQCSFCNIEENNVIKLSAHELQSHPQVQQSKSKDHNRIFCPRCFQKFPRISMYQRHFATHLDLPWISRIRSTQKSQSSTGATKKRKLECPKCGVIVFSNSRFQEHLQIHDEDRKKSFVCPREECGKAYYTERDLRLHIQGHEIEKPFKCSHENCGKSFSRRSYLQVHMKSHKGKNFVCEECGKGFSLKWNLQRHMQAHGTEKPFKCPQEECGKEFSLNSYLQIHLKSHKEKNFVCEECGKEFSLKWNLQRHMQAHGPEKPFKCPHEECGKKFSLKAYLQDHLQTHEPNQNRTKFPCEECGKEFSQKSSLKTHMRTHTKEKPFVCRHCESTFTQRKSLKRHLRNRHNEAI